MTAPAWASRRLKSFGCATEIHGAINATTTTNATIMRPAHDLRFPSIKASQPGIRTRRPATIAGTGAANSTAV